MSTLQELIKNGPPKPSLTELMTEAIEQIKEIDRQSTLTDYYVIKEENETFYFRVIFLFLKNANEYYESEYILDWISKNGLAQEDMGELEDESDEDTFIIEEYEEEI